MEYRSAMGRPCGQLMGQSVAASAERSHSILLTSRRMLTLIAAWQAMTALIMRSNLPALKFAVHYAPFAALVPLAGSDVLDPRTRRFLSLL